MQSPVSEGREGRALTLFTPGVQYIHHRCSLPYDLLLTATLKSGSQLGVLRRKQGLGGSPSPVPTWVTGQAAFLSRSPRVPYEPCPGHLAPPRSSCLPVTPQPCPAPYLRPWS